MLGCIGLILADYSSITTRPVISPASSDRLVEVEKLGRGEPAIDQHQQAVRFLSKPAFDEPEIHGAQSLVVTRY